MLDACAASRARLLVSALCEVVPPMSNLHDALDSGASGATGVTITNERNTRQRLLREAMRLFLRDGYDSVATRQVCEAAGVTQPSLYHHFGSKEGLYFAAIAEWFSDLRDSMTRAIADGETFRDRLLHLALIFWSGEAGEYQAMQRDAMRHMPQARMPALRLIILDSVISPLLELMSAGIASGDLPTYAEPYALMELFWAMVDGFAGLYHRGDALPEPARNTAPIEMFIAGAQAISAETYATWPSMARFQALQRDAG